MDEKLRKNGQQFAVNFGVRELIRFAGAFIALQMIGIVLAMILRNAGFAMVFIAFSFGILWFFPYWQPIYALAYKIIGNKNIPSTIPEVQYKGWSHFLLYIVLGIKLLVLIALFFWGIRLIFFK